jgi:HlyD family secretion protein
VQGGVFVVEDGRARLRRIRVGISGRGAVQVLDGLQDGDSVIVDPPANLTDGARVRAAPADKR